MYSTSRQTRRLTRICKQKIQYSNKQNNINNSKKCTNLYLKDKNKTNDMHINRTWAAFINAMESCIFVTEKSSYKSITNYEESKITVSVPVNGLAANHP